MKQKTLLSITLGLIMLMSFSEVIAATLSDFKKNADEYVISQVGQEYFNTNFEYLGDIPFPEHVSDANTRIVQYAHKISVGDYNQDVIASVWFNFKDGNWSIGNNGNKSADNLPNCIADNTKCMPFQITKERAIEITQNNGVFESADKYTAKISYFPGDINSYVWGITTYESDQNGKSVIISLNTGSILGDITNWAATNPMPEYKEAVSLTGKRTLAIYLIGGASLILIIFIISLLKKKKKHINP